MTNHPPLEQGKRWTLCTNCDDVFDKKRPCYCETHEMDARPQHIEVAPASEIESLRAATQQLLEAGKNAHARLGAVGWHDRRLEAALQQAQETLGEEGDG